MRRTCANNAAVSENCESVRLGPHPLKVTTRGNGNYIGVLIYSSIPILVGGGQP